MTKSYNVYGTGTKQIDAYNTLKNASKSSKLRTGKQMSDQFGLMTGVSDYQSVLDAATNAEYDFKTKQATRALNQSENVSAKNTATAVQSLRNALVGSGSSGANVGAANATALQALLGATQQNQATTLEGLQGLYDIADERAIKKQENAATALTQAESARENAAKMATELYSAEKTKEAQGLLSLADLAGVLSSNKTSYINNNNTNAATRYAARKGQTQNIKYSGGYKVKN